MNWKWIATIQIIAAGLGTAYLAGYCLQQPLTPIRIAGLIITVISFSLWVTARIQLGQSFSIAPKATALVTRGLYSKIRNPIYLFSATWIAGLALALGMPITLLVMAALIPMQAARARREARILEATFGASYQNYRRQTWF